MARELIMVDTGDMEIRYAIFSTLLRLKFFIIK